MSRDMGMDGTPDDAGRDPSPVGAAPLAIPVTDPADRVMTRGEWADCLFRIGRSLACMTGESGNPMHRACIGAIADACLEASLAINDGIAAERAGRAFDPTT